MKTSNTVFKPASLSLVFNLLYALYNGILGINHHSWWFICVSAYYIILSIMRFSVSVCGYTNKKKDTSYFIMKFSGVMFLFLAIVLAGSVYLTLKYDIGTKYHEIIMITIATYTFTKITLAIIDFIKSRKDTSPLITTLASISCADGAISIFSMQRSMLTSFGKMSLSDIFILNLLTGIGVCAVVIVLGLYMIRKDLKKWQNQN